MHSKLTVMYVQEKMDYEDVNMSAGKIFALHIGICTWWLKKGNFFVNTQESVN